MKEISLHILDLVQNSLQAGAKTIDLSIDEDRIGDTFTISIQDDGRGMCAEMARAVMSPFVTTRTSRKVGLGIPLFKAGCEHCEGFFTLKSEAGKGTRLLGQYRYSHIDRPPLGDMAETMRLVILGNPAVRFRYKHRVDGRHYALDTAELWGIWGDAPADAPEISAFLKDFLINNEFELYGGA